ncbi:hypothetical protein CHS0354_030874, partial [Potamilus streckersoni]
ELLSRKEEELNDIREKLSRKGEELHGVRQDLENTKRDLDEKTRKYEEELERKTEKINHIEAEKNELMNRLSAEAAARMTYNNPNITDLSDQNRPTRISERYSELYDNQWTDAFDSLQKSHHLSDTNAIEVLLDVLYVSFDVCKKTRAQREALIKYVTEYVGAARGDVTVLEVMTILKDAKKKNIANMNKDYLKKVQEVLEIKYSKWIQCISPYINECVEICLLMNIQDPALELIGAVLGENPSFDVDVFRSYTKSGDRIEYMVWPALCLHRNGPLLCKGVAQGMSDSSEEHKPSSIDDHTRKKEPKIKVSGQQEEPKVELTKDRVRNGNNVKNEETNMLFAEKKGVQASSNSKGSYRDKRSQKRIDKKSQTQHDQPSCSPGIVTNNSISTMQKKYETEPKKEHKTIITMISPTSKGSYRENNSDQSHENR